GWCWRTSFPAHRAANRLGRLRSSTDTAGSARARTLRISVLAADLPGSFRPYRRWRAYRTQDRRLVGCPAARSTTGEDPERKPRHARHRAPPRAAGPAEAKYVP